jgi:VWFA-related protein
MTGRSVRANACSAVVAAACVFVGAVQGAARVIRHTYVTVLTEDNEPVTGLTPADFRLREGGRDREITSVEPATDPMRIALMVEERLTPTQGTRQGLFNFAQQMRGKAELALVVVGQSNRMAVPFTTDVNAVLAGIMDLPLSQAMRNDHVPEGVADMARAFQEERHLRPVMVVIALNSLQASAEQPHNVLNHLRDSNAQLHVVSIDTPQQAPDVVGAADLMEASGRQQVLGDGPRQSGGRQWPVTALTAIPNAMASIANDLENQYKITYVLPAGTDPSDRLDIRLNDRRGRRILSPTRIWRGE